MRYETLKVRPVSGKTLGGVLGGISKLSSADCDAGEALPICKSIVLEDSSLHSIILKIHCFQYTMGASRERDTYFAVLVRWTCLNKDTLIAFFLSIGGKLSISHSKVMVSPISKGV